MKRLIISLVIIGLVAPAAFAAGTFTLNKAALMMLWETYENPDNVQTGNLLVTDNPLVYGQPITGEVGYTGQIFDPDPTDGPFAQMQIGANFWGTSSTGSGATTAQVIGAALGVAPTGSLVGYDTFALTLTNDNDDDWMVNVSMNTGWTDFPYGEIDNYYENGWTTLAAGQTATLSIDLTTVANLNHITNIGFNVAGNMNGGGSDDPSNPDVFHVSVSSAAVPAPGAILLGSLGTGLVGWLRRRRSL